MGIRTSHIGCNPTHSVAPCRGIERDITLQYRVSGHDHTFTVASCSTAAVNPPTVANVLRVNRLLGNSMSNASSTASMISTEPNDAMPPSDKLSWPDKAQL